MQKGWGLGIKTCYNRLENYLRDTCLRVPQFVTRGEIKAFFDAPTINGFALQTPRAQKPRRSKGFSVMGKEQQNSK